jgi:hypothetical protein
VQGKYLGDTKKKYPIVPVRFVQACPNGHISDIDWYKFVNPNCQSNCPAQLWLDEGGAGNNFADIFVRCEKCGKREPLGSATLVDRPTLGYCRGDRPWLGKNAREECKVKDSDKPERNRLLVRSASNAYFPQIVSVISLPDADSKLKDGVTSVYEDFLQYAEELADITKERRKQKVANALAGLSDEVVWAEVQRRKTGTTEVSKTIKQVELETLLSCETTLGEDSSESDFYATNYPLAQLPPLLEDTLSKIVLVHRLREVMALIGFTRFEAELPDIDGELSMEVRRGALDIEITWTPAIENRGEGIFLAFNSDKIANWEKQELVKKRGHQLLIGFEKWKQQRGLKKDEAQFPGLPYILLHSISHLLISAISLECGYSASSLKERIYATQMGHGILLYTGTTGSEGTLGGLIEVGKNIEYYFLKALELGRLCSNDPVCSQHRPDQEQEDRLLHGCACHGCLLIAETSCERNNQFLDRSLVVDTLGICDVAFFPHVKDLYL